jgi:LysR family glycine cleavage system transcriptional activator
VTRLCKEEIFPVCSPALVRGRRRLRSPADLVHHPLLHATDHAHWRRWLDHHHVEAVDGGRGVVFSQASMAIDAAIQGQGVAMARTALAAWDLLAGRLVRPFSEALDAPFAMWIVCPKASADLPKIATFREWLLREAADDQRRLKKLGVAGH